MAANPQTPILDPDHDPNPDTHDPYEGLPPLAANMTWTAFPFNDLWLSDTAWYDSLGNSQVVVRRIFSSFSKSEQVAAALTLFEEFPARGRDIMFDAAVKGKAWVISALLAAGVTPQPAPGTEDDVTLVCLHAAAHNGQLEAVKVIVEEGGAEVDAKDELGGTALMRACFGGQVEVVAWLLERGADAGRRQDDSEERTPGTGALEFAAGKGCVECVKLLLEWRKSGGAVGRGGAEVTPLALEAGAHSGSLEMVRLLVGERGWPTDEVDERGVWKGERLSGEQRGEVLQMLTRVTTNVDLLEFLVSYLAKPDASGNFEYLDLPQDVREKILDLLFGITKNTEVVKLFWNVTFSSPELTTIEYDGQQIPKIEYINDMIHEAAKTDTVETAKFFFAMPGADVNTPGLKKVGHLYRAAIDEKLDMVRYLLENHKPDLHQGNGLYANGGTALFGAVLSGNAEIVKLILQHGGPLESPIHESIKSKEPKKVVVKCVQTFRAPVTMEVHPGDDSLPTEQGTKFVVLELDENDAEWLDKVEIRKSDEELKKDDRGERELKPRG
ncbi:ankyrin [Lophium mytilinum]|uniref:Ankyrin n=1 Tax=Lophium mytilinum TaxID=390894 RepID=A0A6A6QFN7_9PEZI|nr:ankyrin [Lophium mytilinum]